MQRKIFLAALVLLLVPSASYSFDREKLILLDPLPSVRLKHVVETSKKNKLIATTVFGLSGGWIIGTNIGKGIDAYRVNNLLAGSSLLVTAAMDLMVPDTYISDLKLLDEIGSKGMEKETIAYFEIKSKAHSSLVARRTTALIYLLSSLGSAVIAGNSPNFSDSERTFTNLNAAGFLCLAAYQLLWPSEAEISADEIDKELSR